MTAGLLAKSIPGQRVRRGPGREGVRAAGLSLDFCGPVRVTAERALCRFNKRTREQNVGAKPAEFLDSVQRATGLGVCGRSMN